MVYDQLVAYLLKKNYFQIISQDFIQITQLRMFSYVLLILGKELFSDESKFTAVAFLDISKAFDIVNHDITIQAGMLWCVRTLSYLVCELLMS